MINEMRIAGTTEPGNEIVSTRIIDVPREIVYRAWSDPEHLANWWGPAGFSNTFHVFEFRVGGSWRFTMHGPGKGHYENACEFTDIVPPSLIAWKRYSKPLFRVVVTFDEVSPERTKLVFRQVFDTVEECNKLKTYVVDKNEENFDRLETELIRMMSDPGAAKPG